MGTDLRWIARFRRLWRLMTRFVTWRSRSPDLVSPPLERRRSLVAQENYAARHPIDQTLDRKAGLRRLAPYSREAAERYHELLTYELAGVEEVTRVLRSSLAGPELADFLTEATQELERLRIEVTWAAGLLSSERMPEPASVGQGDSDVS